MLLCPRGSLLRQFLFFDRSRDFDHLRFLTDHFFSFFKNEVHQLFGTVGWKRTSGEVS